MKTVEISLKKQLDHYKMGKRNEVHINSALQLLHARKEALDRMNRSPMRPHGKVLGRDLFTWFDYHIDDLVSTFNSFPNPIHWVVTKEEFKALFLHSKKLISKIDTVIIYDSAQFELSYEIADQIINCISVDSMSAALTMMRAVEKTGGVMLISGIKSDWKQHEKEIEAFIATFKK